MEHVLNQGFLPEKYFEEICAIPHGSYNEKPLSDHLVRLAQEHGLRYRQYPNSNVIIYKPASAGYEDHEPVMLQAHIDMVCEKEPGCEHDFEKDPLQLYVEDGCLHARGTTLGADDGVGVAYMMSILADETAQHPPLECVFTVQEEVGLIGAKELAFEDLSAKRMIGMDDMGGNTCYVSACGSQHIAMERTYEYAVHEGPAYTLTVDGLLGGHSGVCIKSERGNAIKLAARVLRKLSEKYPVQIGSVRGGDKDNAIPFVCEVVFTCGADREAVELIVREMGEIFRSELEFSDPDVQLTLGTGTASRVLSEKDSSELIRMLCLMPHGLRHKSMKIAGLTTVSENLANIRTEQDRIVIRYFTRSEQSSYLEVMADELGIICDLFGYSVEYAEAEPGWKYEEHSPIREALFAAYHEVTGEHMTPIAEHGGLETGFISGGIPGIDIVTCGPLCEGYHTTKEFLDLESFHTIYEVICHTLRSL